MPFTQIRAQDAPIDVLRRSLREDQVGHAYLFYGPEAIGKRATALAFAKALNCTDEVARAQGDFCGQCRSCRMITLGQHPDVRLLTPETTGGKTVIPLDAIRTKVGESPSHPLPLREDAQRKPLEGRYKVYILDPANRPGFQEDAGNALLLTLEEPPPYVVIILISSRPSAVLPTLVSRCQPLRFHLAPHTAVCEALLATGGVEADAVNAIAGMAAGRIGWALSAAANAQVLQLRRDLFEEIARLFPAGRPAALRLAETMHRLASATEMVASGDDTDEGNSKVSSDRVARKNLPELLDMTATWWRDVLVTALGQQEMVINQDFTAIIAQQAARLSPVQLREGLQLIMQTKRLIERNANISLALERMWMTILP